MGCGGAAAAKLSGNGGRDGILGDWGGSTSLQDVRGSAFILFMSRALSLALGRQPHAS